MKNYDKVIDETMCKKCREWGKACYPHSIDCPWRGIDNEYCEDAQKLADYIKTLKEKGNEAERP